MFGNAGFRIVAGIVLVLVLIGGAVALGWTAYGMGLAQGAAQGGEQLSPQAGAPVPAPFYYGGYAPYRFHPYGFGFLGCLAPLFFLFLVFFLFRMVFWGGMGRHRHWGWGPKGPFSPDDMPGHWREMAERWHREQHGEGEGKA
jgi:hypothetical protein